MNDHMIGFDLDLYVEKYWGKARKWRPYTMLLSNGNAFADGYREISSLLYAGLSYRKKIQFGLGSGIASSSEVAETDLNFGVFVSFKFD